MFILPNNLPLEIRDAIEPQAQTPTLEDFLSGAAQAVSDLFVASDAFLLLHVEYSPENLRQISYLGGQNGPRSEQTCKQFTRRWLESNIHYYVAKDLHSRLASISYSAFSWPYPRLATSSLSADVGFTIPREYTLLLPFCSDLIVRESSEPLFFGYTMLLFETFPSLADSVVQLIISLPELFSEIIAAYLRRE